MGHDGDAALGQEPDGFRHAFATLKLDRAAAGFLHDAGGVAKRDIRAFFVGAKGHVHHDQRALCTANNGLAVHDHQVQRHANRAFHAVHNHAKAVTHQNEIGVFVDDCRRVRVIGCQRYNRLATFAAGDLRHGHPADGFGLGAHRVISLWSRSRTGLSSGPKATDSMMPMVPSGRPDTGASVRA